MKKLVLSLSLVTFISASTFAQTTFGVTAGATFASMKSKVESISVNSDAKVGFTLGLLAELGLTENISLQPGLNFTQKGGKLKYAGDESTQTLNYLELPINFLYKAEIGSGKLFGGLGPVLGYGISGKAKSKEAGQPEISQDINFGGDEMEDDYKPFEVAGNILAGYEFSNGLFAAVNYNMGLSSIAQVDDNDYTTKNRYFGIRIGYKFGSGK